MNFIDTNILLYAFGADDGSSRPEKARALLAEGDLAFFIQVFQEFYVQVTHSRRKEPLTQAEAREVIGKLTAYPVQINDYPVFLDAIDIQMRFQISFWDALILAAARALKCETVFSEDLNPGQDYGGVVVRSPFQFQ